MNGKILDTSRARLLKAAVLMVCASALALPAAAEEFDYVGSASCKMCHNKEVSGKQFDLWAAGPHAKAYATLANDQSQAIAKEMGIDDPQKADACLRCHVTAHGVAAERLGRRFSIEEGVGCESCHGPGSAYVKLPAKKKYMAGEMTAAEIGLVESDEAQCRACHNEESPTHKGFEYAEALELIAHPIPAAHMEQYKK